MTTNNPNPSTDNFDDIEFKQEMERKEADYPKKADGSVDVDALTTEQQATYWKSMHDASTRGFHQFQAKTRKEIEDLKSLIDDVSKTDIDNAVDKADNIQDFEKLIPDFDLLDQDAQSNLRAIFNGVNRTTRQALDNDPAIMFARRNYNEKKWDESFERISAKFPDLVADKATFKANYFNPKNSTPDNIDDILTTFAKSFLFDKSFALGEKETIDKMENRVNLGRSSGNADPARTSAMTLDDWTKLQEKNPREFARRSAEYKRQLANGELKE